MLRFFRELTVLELRDYCPVPQPRTLRLSNTQLRLSRPAAHHADQAPEHVVLGPQLSLHAPHVELPGVLLLLQ